jgi:hypothetical protein
MLSKEYKEMGEAELEHNGVDEGELRLEDVPF